MTFFHLVTSLLAIYLVTDFPGDSGAKNQPACRRHRLDPWVSKIPWRRAW